MTKLSICVIPVVLGLLLARTVAAQSGGELQALGREIEALKAGQTAIQKELQEIKSLLQRSQVAQAPTPTPARAGAETVDLMVSIEGAPVKGDKNAKVTVVEFTDYQCPFCARYFRQTWPQLEQDYVKTGKVKFVLRDLPLESIHPLAFKAAEATHCAGAQGKFWEMHDRLFANPAALARSDLAAHAQALGLEAGAFDKCMESGGETARVRKDVVDGGKVGARGTPTFFIGLSQTGNADIRAVRVIRGAHPYATFKEAIDSLLATAK